MYENSPSLIFNVHELAKNTHVTDTYLREFGGNAYTEIEGKLTFFFFFAMTVWQILKRIYTFRF